MLNNQDHPRAPISRIESGPTVGRRAVTLKQLVSAITVACLGGLAVAPLFAVGEPPVTVPSSGCAIVSQGPIDLVVTQSGTLDSARNATLTNKCEWSTRILHLLPEGTWVERGDLVMELDSSELRERAQKRQILLVEAESRLAQAREDMEIQKLRNESLLADAKLDAELARLELDGYVEADFPRQRHELESEIALAEEEVTRARKQLQFVEQMAEKGYRTQSDRESARLALLKKEQQFELAKDKLRVLTEFTHPRTVEQLTAAAKEKEAELKRVTAMQRVSLLSRKIRLASFEKSYEIHKAYLDRVQRSIDACTVRAKQAGEVVYPTTSRSSSKKLEEGSAVRFRQLLATIPDRTTMKVELRIHESRIRHIELGQRAVVRVDATGHTMFQGRVINVATVPLSPRYPNYDLREYTVEVAIDEPSDVVANLAPGMTANVDIYAASREMAVHVPVHAVAAVGGDHYAFVRVGDNVETRQVELGLQTDELVEVVSGLEPGEEVVVSPRTTIADRVTWLERTVTSQASQDDWFHVL